MAEAESDNRETEGLPAAGREAAESAGSLPQDGAGPAPATAPPAPPPAPQLAPNEEIGGPKGPEPTRYGDWEKDGRCIDF